MINGERRPSSPKSARVTTIPVEALVQERSTVDSQAKKKVTRPGRNNLPVRTVSYKYRSCRGRGKYTDSWLVLFVIHCIISGADQKTLVAPEKN